MSAQGSDLTEVSFTATAGAVREVLGVEGIQELLAVRQFSSFKCRRRSRGAPLPVHFAGKEVVAGNILANRCSS